MPVFSIEEAKPYHCGQMVRILRTEHQQAIARVQLGTHRQMRGCFDASCFRKAWMIEGRLAGLGGIIGTVASPTGFVWLALSNEALRYPVAIVKEARKQLAEIMVVKRELATTIIEGDEAAKRLAIFLGFHVADDGPGAPANSKKDRQVLMRHMENRQDIRVPVGNGFAIAMGYHHEEAA
ncbi:hypothetical protein FHT86_002140 [Rhizobium sp. BK313]|uniref:hypothetical protein n=1 Tax=Rhizobium sp. BK313 TaxID=2587081 RepID=UPI001613DC27|nr:hypothetical protein [Rhizobium sp. BK313]MBB3453884.1 hypothetical protein [Rhizobium sp. BK313]